MEAAAIRLQRRVCIKQLSKELIQLKFSHKLIEENTFETFTEMIQDKDLQAVINKIIRLINNIADYGSNNIISAQDFFSSFVIYGYREEVMNTEETDPLFVINSQIICSANKLVSEFSLLSDEVTMYRINKFNKYLKQYKKDFVAWKRCDKHYMIHIITCSYYQLDTVIKEEEKLGSDEEATEAHKMYINICKDRQKDLLKKVKELNGLPYLQSFDPHGLSLDNTTKQQIYETAHSAFWDIFHRQLLEDPPNYTMLLNLLTDLRNRLCKFVPNRPDICEEIHESIDIELITNMITNNAFDNESLKKLCLYIISKVKSFQPPIMDEDVDLWETNMLEHFKKQFEYVDFLPTFFRSVFNMMDNIVAFSQQLVKEQESCRVKSQPLHMS
jgi:hypothetical protein